MVLATNLIEKYEDRLFNLWVKFSRFFELLEFKLGRLRLFLVRFFYINWLIFSLVIDRHLTSEQKFRKFFERASGAFIKFGQILSMRYDLLPARFTAELFHLLSDVEIQPFSEMEKVFLAELGRSPDDLFLDFDPRPIASASISQVYKAKLKNGMPVVVKIKRPNIQAVFETDFILAYFLAASLNIFGLFKYINVKQMVADFIDWTKQELDFQNEMKNAQSFYNYSASYPRTVIPKVYPEYSTSRVLVMEYIALPFSADQVLRRIETDPNYSLILKTKYNIDVGELAYYFVKDGLRQFFVDGFFHADPHPANLFFLPGGKLGYFDFGIVGKAGPDRLYILRMLYGIGQKDWRLISKNLMAFTKEAIDRELEILKKHNQETFNRYVKIIAKVEEILIDEIANELESTLSSLYDKKTRSSGAASLLKLLIKAEEHGLYLPRNVAIFLRSFIIADMVATKLDSEFDAVAAINQFFTEHPLAETEKIIAEITAVKSVAADELWTLPVGLSYEELLELKILEKEELNDTLEHLIDLASFYAENYNEVRQLLKSNK